MRLLGAALILLAGPAAADARLADFFGGHGCTIGPESRAALQAQSVASPSDLAAYIAGLRAAEQVSQEGEYLVIDAEVCTIRLPRIESRWSADDPEIRAMAPFTSYTFPLGDETVTEQGCFLADPFEAFTMLNAGDADAGFRDYADFVASGVISGEVRFYGTSPLRTPAGFQLTRGACAEVPEFDAMTENHRYIAEGFGDYVRLAYETTPCGEQVSFEATMGALALQGIDLGADPASQPDANAWMWMEFMFITMAAGWHDGLSATERGLPRPPLCHVP